MKKNTLSVFSFFLWIFLSPVNAQIGSFYSTDNALSNSLVNCIYQDSRKYIWIATEDGLNKFDGVRFTVYHNSRDDKFSLKNNYVRTVFEDSKGRIWIGCINGLQVYNRAEDNFREVPVYFGKNKVEPHITSILETSDGEILMSTSGIGIIRSSKDCKSFVVDEDLFPRLCSRYLVALHQDKKGQIWIASENKGLDMFHPKTGRMVCFSSPSTIASNHISSIAEDIDGNIFVGTLTGGLFRYNLFRHKFEAINYMNSSVILPIKCLSFDNSGRLLVGTDGRGVKFLNKATGVLEDYQLISFTFDLSKTKVHSLFNDKEGNLWMGLFQKGVFLSPNHRNEFSYWGVKSFYRNIIGPNCVMSLLQDKQGSVWVGTDNDGMYAINGDCSRHFCVNSTANGVSGTIMSIIEGDKNTLWLGSYIDGLVKFDKTTGTTTFYKNNNLGLISNAAANKAMSIARDPQNRIWIGTNGAGIQIFDPKISKYVGQLLFNEEDSSGIANNWVNCLVNDGDSLMWIGTYKGVSSVNLRTGKITTFRKSNEKLVGNIVLSILRDSRGFMWFGTTEGLTCFNPLKHTFEQFTTKEGLAGNVICGILEDEKGNLWLSTHKGISNLIVPKKHFINYNAYDGLQGNEFSTGAAYKTSLGEMFFGGVTGVTSFFPAQITDQKAPIELYLTGFYVFDKLVVKGQKSGAHVILNDFVSDVKTIKLDYKDNMFSLEFSTFDYGNQGRVFYTYKMEGMNDHWINTERGVNRIVFNSLRYGHYKLHVKACIKDKESKEKVWDIVIYPPWYLSAIAKLIYFILILGFIWVIYRIIVEQINHRHELMRREHLEQVNEGKLQFFINISHEIRTPMSLIISPLEKLLVEDKDSERQEVYRLMHRNAQRILRLINQLLDVRKIDKGQMSIKMREADLVSFINDLIHTFEYQAKKRGIKLGFIHEMPELKVWIDINNFDKVLVNILSNAFKFTPEKGEINIILNTGVNHESSDADSHLDEYFEIIVSDSGIGIQEDKIEKIFERFYQIDNAQINVNFGTGIGLHLAKNLVELMHGKIFAQNKVVGKGSEFIIRLPLGNSHLSQAEKENLSSAIESVGLPERKEYNLVNEIEVDCNFSEQAKYHSKSRAKTKYKVLIVDDEDEIRQYLLHELSDNYRVAECSNGKNALEYILKEKPDLVVSDVMMAEMDGMTLCKKIKSNVNINYIPVVLLTARTSDEDKGEGFEIGADAYISKPFNVELLKKRIASILANHERLEHKSMTEKDSNPLIHPVELKSNDQILLEKIMKVINENISDHNLNVKMLADKIGMSRVHMYRKLKELTNMSARDFIRSIRLKQAGDLLASQKLTVSEVAYALGFASLSHFSNSFKEFHGVSPKEYSHGEKNDEDV
ncbi:MAG: hybrid sensor histidine kinase/response regulator [Bacteroidetes bacterium]|nr:hybrid sensor histidine kinase/response regulator [Bacteroidota bacterium]